MLTQAASKPKPLIVKKPWQNGLGPYYIGLFLWIVFFDQLGMRTLQVGGIIWSVLGAVVAGPLCYLLLFRIPATWGHTTGKALPELAQSTFGQRGAKWVPGLLIGLAELVWFAVAVYYGTDLTLKGLVEARFINQNSLQSISVGGFVLKSPLFLATSLFWSVAAALVGRWLVRLIAAIMHVYPIFPALIFGATMLVMLSGVRSFEPTGIDPQTLLSIPPHRVSFWSIMLVIQMIFGFFAMAGAIGVDWGAATTTDRDVQTGGWIAVGVAPIVIASIGFVTIAGYLGRLNELSAEGAVEIRQTTGPFTDPLTLKRIDRPQPPLRAIGLNTKPPEASFRAVLIDGIGGRLGCAMLMIVGVAALAPAVYCSFVISTRFHDAFPRISRTRWTLVAIALAWPLVAFGLVENLERVFTLMGALFAPLVACLSADSQRQRGQWSGPRRGLNLPGVCGWLAGVPVGLLPLDTARFGAFQPAAFWAFVVAYVVYWLVAKVVGEAQVVFSTTDSESVTLTELPSPVDLVS